MLRTSAQEHSAQEQTQCSKIDLYVYVFVFEIDMCVYESEIHHRLFPPLCLLRLLNIRPPPQVDYVLRDNPRREAALGFCKGCRRRRRERKSSWVFCSVGSSMMTMLLTEVPYAPATPT
ncbi:unnamed protein product [Lactuca virosa]|uniref:Uncharacterized protein n=1 Tax=Lactuca virosa TaxID=75947 RepID=A0AAU9MRL6_9ASTR|nr:unnamed protein product [Lactuca virosa]